MSRHTETDSVTIARFWGPLKVTLVLGGGVAALLAISAITSATPSPNLAELFAFEKEGNVVTWYSVVLWLFLTMILKFMASRHRRLGEPSIARSATALSYLALFFSIDEASGLSLKIRLVILDFGLPTQGLDQDQIWLYIYGLMLVLILGIATSGLVRLFQVSPKAVIGLVAGGITLLGSGLGFEITPFIKAMPYEPVVEETLEMVGVIIMIWGALQGLHRFEITSVDASPE